MSNIVLQAKNVNKVFSDAGNELKAVNDLSLEVRSGEFALIMGASGSGKTTLLHLLAGLDTPSSGEIELAGEMLSRLKESARGQLRNKHLGFVYQFHHLLPEFTALENVCMPLFIANESKKSATKKAQACLEQVGLAERVLHKPAELSGGERQRVAIARALVNEPKIVMADEPTGNLDSENAQAIKQLIKNLTIEQGMSFLCVTHDEDFKHYADRCFTMKDGALI